MRDRVSLYPGRWKLNPVSGQSDVYDFERADGATVVGTALNRNSLLSETVQNKLGLDDDSTPSDALNELANEIEAIHAGLFRRIVAVESEIASNNQTLMSEVETYVQREINDAIGVAIGAAY